MRIQFHFVELVGEEDAVEDEREAQTNQKAGTIPPVVCIAEINVAESGVGVERLGGERRRHDKEREGAAGHKVILSLLTDLDVGEGAKDRTHGQEDEDADAIGGAEGLGGHGIWRRARDTAVKPLSLRIVLGACTFVWGAAVWV